MSKKSQRRHPQPQTEPSPSASAPLPRWIGIALAAAAAILLLGIYSTEFADTDAWWHLATGRYIVEHKSLPTPDPFSYTTALGEPAYPQEPMVREFNLTHEWLAQAWWYLIYLVAGFPGLVLWKALLLAFVSGAAGWLAARRSGSVYLGAAAALVGAPVIVLFAADRPALLTFFLVAAFVVLLEKYLEDGRKLWLWALVPLELIWANSHGGFFLGWVVVGAYAAGSIRKPVRVQKPIWIALALVTAVSALNPNGLRIFQVLSAYRQSFLTSTLIEWKQPQLWGPPYTYDILLYAGALAIIAGWRRLRLTDALLFAAFAAASLLAFRNIILIAFLAPVMIAVYAWPLVKQQFGGAPTDLLEIGVCVLALAFAGHQAWNGGMFRFRAAEWKFPHGAAEFIRTNNLNDPMFNSYEFGGYLIWALAPEYKVFIDGRALNENVYRDYSGIISATAGGDQPNRPAVQRLLDKYGVRYIVMAPFEYVSGVLYPVLFDLLDLRNIGWQPIYQDAQALVFERDSPERRAWIEQHSIPKATAVDNLIDACANYIEHDPELSNCARVLGFTHLKDNDPQHARQAFELYFAHIDFDDPPAQQAYQYAVQASQTPPAAK